MDLSQLSTGDKMVIVAALVLIVAVVGFPWIGTPDLGLSAFGVKDVGVSFTFMDYSGGLAFLVLLGAAVAIAVPLLRMFAIFDISEQGVQEGLVVLVAAGIAGAGVLIRVLSTGGGVRKWGMWIGLVCAAVAVIGAVMKFQEERA